jgi:electron transport complex protein RnfC
MNGSLLTFPKGEIHPPDEKELSQDCAVEVMPAPHEVEMLLQQHFGSPCKALVKRKDQVRETNSRATA